MLFFLPHTQTLSAPQHLVPSAPESVLVSPPGSLFHFASLYLSHITLKIEGKWARRCDERKRVSLLGLSLDLFSTHTHTHTSSAHLILEGRRGRACKLKLPLMPLVFQNRGFRGWQIEKSEDSHEVTGGNL